MTTTLRVIVDDVVAPMARPTGRYAEELTRALIETAPPGCQVAGIISAVAAENYAKIERLLPGLADLFKGTLARRELQLAWQHGITKLPGSGMVHAPSPLAPLSRHDRTSSPGDQIVVTFHDAAAWSHPHLLNPREVSWTKAMARRARRYADAVIVPTHAVAESLNEDVGFGERVRVIGGAVSSKLDVPVDADRRAEALALPQQYLLAAGTVEPRKKLDAVIQSLAIAGDALPPLLVAGPVGWGDVDLEAIAREAGLAEGRVRHLGWLTDADLAVALDRATVFVLPALGEGFGTAMLEAFRAGTPVVHADSPSLVEVAAEAGVAVPSADEDLYPDLLARTLTDVVADPVLRERLGYLGRDRSAAFSWSDTAQRVWQVHADL